MAEKPWFVIRKRPAIILDWAVVKYRWRASHTEAPTQPRWGHLLRAEGITGRAFLIHYAATVHSHRLYAICRGSRVASPPESRVQPEFMTSDTRS